MARPDQVDGREFPWGISGAPGRIVFTTATHEVMVGPVDPGEGQAHLAVRRRDGKKAENGENGAILSLNVGETGIVPWLRINGHPILLTLNGFEAPEPNRPGEKPAGKTRAIITITRPRAVLVKLIQESLAKLESEIDAAVDAAAAPAPVQTERQRKRDKRELRGGLDTKQSPPAEPKPEPSEAEQIQAAGTEQDRHERACRGGGLEGKQRVKLQPAERHLIRAALGLMAEKVLRSHEYADELVALMGNSGIVNAGGLLMNWLAEVTEKILPPH